jgi:hypothetical protein
VQVINPSQPVRVVRLSLDERNQGQALVGDGNVVIISGITEGTAEKASYSWTLSP